VVGWLLMVGLLLLFSEQQQQQLERANRGRRPPHSPALHTRAAHPTQRAVKALPTQLGQFHSTDYIEFLSMVRVLVWSVHSVCLILLSLSPS
jgi:hypothetical protein